MEILRCIDELEHLVESSNSMPLTHHKIVDEDAFFVTTQRLKNALPEELKKAIELTRQADATSVDATMPDTKIPPPRLRAQDTLLLIVDVQERLMPAIHGAESVEKNCILLAQAARQLRLPIVVTEQNPNRLGATSNPLREAAGFPSAISKMLFSACTESTLSAIQSSGRKTILLCGVEAHVCVLQTALDLREREYSVFVARDAISSRTPENAEVGWQRMLGAGVLPTSAESAVFELLKEAGTPDFKALLPALK